MFYITFISYTLLINHQSPVRQESPIWIIILIRTLFPLRRILPFIQLISDLFFSISQFGYINMFRFLFKLGTNEYTHQDLTYWQIFKFDIKMIQDLQELIIGIIRYFQTDLKYLRNLALLMKQKYHLLLTIIQGLIQKLLQVQQRSQILFIQVMLFKKQFLLQYFWDCTTCPIGQIFTASICIGWYILLMINSMPYKIQNLSQKRTKRGLEFPVQNDLKKNSYLLLYLLICTIFFLLNQYQFFQFGMRKNYAQKRFIEELCRQRFQQTRVQYQQKLDTFIQNHLKQSQSHSDKISNIQKTISNLTSANTSNQNSITALEKSKATCGQFTFKLIILVLFFISFLLAMYRVYDKFQTDEPLKTKITQSAQVTLSFGALVKDSVGIVKTAKGLFM